jgi:hypothetical protein
VSNIVPVFLEGARAVSEAIADGAVAEAWDQPSVLEDQAVSGLVGHLARGGVWVVGDYLTDDEPPGPVDFQSAAEYFDGVVSVASAEVNRGSRQRGAAIASVGHAELVRQLAHRLESLGPTIEADPDRLVAVIGGAVMRLRDYLATRVVEQAVHLGDLARSINHSPWPYPEEGQNLAIEIAIDMARHRHGSSALLRALYRSGQAAHVFPVL